jgi:hypothetical protein
LLQPETDHSPGRARQGGRRLGGRSGVRHG